MLKAKNVSYFVIGIIMKFGVCYLLWQPSITKSWWIGLMCWWIH